MKKAFVLGPGYVGREIIDLLKSEGKYAITTMVRRDAAAKEFSRITTFMGDLDDTSKIQGLARDSDLVFHTATADHIPSAKAILDGIKERAAEGKRTIYLHQSGASVLSDGSAGDVSDAKKYSDFAPVDINGLPDTAPHRSTDLAILKARRELGTAARIFIMIPPIIYGANPKYNRLSMQIPKMTRYTFEKGHAPIVGAGKGRWGAVHVLDLAKAYMTIVHWLEQSPQDSAISNPYFFCESEEIAWGEVSRIIGKAVYAAGKIQTPEPKVVPESQWSDLYGDFTPNALASNCRCSADRLRAMGWKPVQRTLAEAFIEEDLPVMLKE
ncbi:NAD(P)-binding protein [Pseudovirgaria hyperparasitica]|uniref:NAD(P)-binding protein n=1 Tax=Pseudovirgaria hyperparasitica TaxID=470096 RepID=A0A6A6WJG3_9PEZI|nr:NAD(P)-binding protein [Pseudovirgaria hyperparasitica]KAF2761471.1 NAD(P)-binding protein [Pseudovirgaria hyperparasitica]